MKRRLMTAMGIAAAVMALSYLAQGPGQSARAKFQLGWKCSSEGALGCYYCPGNPSPGGAGCASGNIGSWAWGKCKVANKSDACSETTQVCGDYILCGTNTKVGDCLSFPICIDSPLAGD
ncbi:MAG: hypothetical protein U0800_15925 [Isosphaeraceae bacterium]